MAEHKGGLILLVVLVSMVLVATIAVNVWVTLERNSRLFEVAGIEDESTNETLATNRNYNDISPASWAFGIWGVIYIWQLLMVFYWFSLLCRQTKDGYLYHTPRHNHPAMWIFYILNLGANMAWLLIWELDILYISSAVLAFMTFTLYVCIGISVYCLWKNANQLIHIGQRKEIWLSIFIVQNGFGVYATWCTLATLLNFISFLIYDVSVEVELAGTIILGIVAFELLFWFILDNFVLEKYFRYMLTPYAVLLWTLGAAVDENGDTDKRNGIFLMVLLGVAGLAALGKIVLVIFRSYKRPLIMLMQDHRGQSYEEKHGMRL